MSGEDLACSFLENKGYKIKCRNFRSGHGELDIICDDGSDLVIVEVKSIRKSGFGLGGERVPVKQQREIIKTTYRYLSYHPLRENQGVRFDIVLIDFRYFPAKIEHFEEAFWQR